MQMIERQMVRRLHGELNEAEARELERHLAAEPALEARFRELERAWNRLQDPPATPLDPAFTAQVMKAAQRQVRGEFSWATAPVWARTGGALALTAGLALGVALAEIEPDLEASFATGMSETAPQGDLFAEPPSLAESWWRAVEEGAFEEEDLPNGGGEGR